MWAERYDGSSADVFALQDKVTNNIVSALALKLTPQEVESVAKAGTDNAPAHDAYLLGLSHYHRRTPQDNATAKDHCETAVQLDPNYAAAYSALAKVYLRGIFDWSYGEKLGVSRVEGTSRPWKYLQKAKAKPNSDYFIVRSRLALKRHQPDRAISEARRALDLSSNDTEAMEALAAGLIFAGQSKAGIEYAQNAMRQNPTHLGRPLYLIGLAEFSLGNTAEAVEFLNRAIKHAPDEARFYGVLAAAYGELGQTAQARAAFENWKPGDGTWRLDEIVAKYPISDAGVLDRFADGLKDVGVSVQSGGYYPVHTTNKLTGPEIKTLLFGSQIGGDHPWCSSYCLWRQVRTADGTVQHLGHPIQPGVAAKDSGSGKIKNNMLCEIWPKLAKDIELCVAVFRITDRIARIKWGDYIMVTDHGPMPFSLTD